MRTFTSGSAGDRKSVVLEVQEHRLFVVKVDADGTNRRTEREFANEASARSACADAAQKLTSNGYTEEFARDARIKKGIPDGSENPAPRLPPEDRGRGLIVRDDTSGKAAPPLRRSTPSAEPRREAKPKADKPAWDDVLEDAGPMLSRLAPAVDAAPKKKSGGKKKKRKAARAEGELDKKVVVGFAAFGVACLAFVGFLGYQAFFKPATIIGHWEGSMTEHEIGKFLRNTEYRLILDEGKNASMSIEGGDADNGTYVLQGNRLKLNFKDEEGESFERQYKVQLGGATLDLYDPESGKKVVQLIRYHESTAAKSRAKNPASAPKDVAVGPVDKDADRKLASVAFAVQDQAFALRHPPGWEVETGGRSDNSYSWAKFNKGSARMRVYADVAGSLVAGSPSGNYEEGSEMAPVHGAHERYKKIVEELYGKYEEGTIAPFKGSGMGEGRIAPFTASGEGLFGAKIKGIRVTFLSNDRRVSILCDAPAKEFDALLPTFLAVCRSLSR